MEAAFIVDAVEVGSPTQIWARYGNVSGITQDEFREYFKGRTKAYIIAFQKVMRLKEPATLSEIRAKARKFHPPQFFKRLHKGSAELALFVERLTRVRKLSKSKKA